ncbi:MAG: hypothetical protein KGI28_00330 [Thaumarchaeota archaeon]|nr:hypothetical protein [Nitrososphaerota archaeon]
MFDNIFSLILATILISSMFIPVYALQSNMLDPNIQVTLDYPDVIQQGDKFVLSSIIKSTADQVSNITLTISSPELYIVTNTFNLAKLAKDSTYGNDFKLSVKNDTPDGEFVANAQVTYFVKGMFDANPVKNTFTQAFHLNTQSKPILILDVEAPSNVFSGEPFSIKGTIKNHGATAQNIQLKAYSSDINLDGKKSFLLSNLYSGKNSDFEFVVNTSKDLDIPTNAIIHINGTYFDDLNKSYSIEDSVNIFARHRGMLEIGDANGIWIGNFFIAPVVGVGTIVSSAIGFFIFLWHFKNKKKSKNNKKTKFNTTLK